MKQSGPPPVTDTPSLPPLTDTESTKNVLTTTQWLSVISIVVSLAGIYYKGKEIKGLLTKKPPLTPPPVPFLLLILHQKEASNRWIENQLNFSLIFITMVVLQTLFKKSAVSGIAFFWVGFTVMSSIMAWLIVSTSPESVMVVLKTLLKTAAVSGITFFWVGFTVMFLIMAWLIVSTSPVMCESCHGYGGELIHRKLLCVFCRDDLVRYRLKIN